MASKAGADEMKTHAPTRDHVEETVHLVLPTDGAAQ